MEAQVLITPRDLDRFRVRIMIIERGMVGLVRGRTGWQACGLGNDLL